MEYKTVLITPEMAQEFLGRNPNNRTIRRKRVDVMAKDMRLGLWRLSPQPIIIDTDGNLLDGQYRLSAVVQSNIPIQFTVCYNADKACMEILDHGSPRTTSDLLSIEGYSNAAIVAAISRKVVAHNNGSKSMVAGNSQSHGTGAGNNTIASKQEVAEFARKNFDEIEEVARKALVICGKSKVALLSPSEVGFFLYVLSPHEKAEDFFLKVVGGIGLEEKTPEHKLRLVIERGRVAKKIVITSMELTKMIFEAFEKALKSK